MSWEYNSVIRVHAQEHGFNPQHCKIKIKIGKQSKHTIKKNIQMANEQI